MLMRDAEKYVAAAMRSACDTVASALKGIRNDTLNREAFGIGRIVGTGLLGYDVAKLQLMGAARDAGIDKHEANSSIDSGRKAA